MFKLREPLDPERQAALAIQVTMRWLLIGVALFMMLYRPGSGPIALTGILILIGLAALMNVELSRRIRQPGGVSEGLALTASMYDLFAITAAVGLADGFANDSYLLYYPALLGFAVVFGPRWSAFYVGIAMPAYALTATLTHNSFDPGLTTHVKNLVLRLAIMVVITFSGNLIIGIERRRRMQAVAAEAERGAQVLALERRARDLEREAADERHRLSQEVHDGVSQDVYMLTLGLETASALAEREGAAPPLQERLDTLVRLSKQTLLDTRNLLFDLGHVMTGQQGLSALATNQAREFSAVTGIAADLAVEGEERPLPPEVVGEIYRVLQEGLANVYKHAGVSECSVRLAYGAEALTLAISENGKGFDPSLIERGNGLANMRERAERLGGSLAVESGAGRGTRLVLSIPWKEA